MCVCVCVCFLFDYFHIYIVKNIYPSRHAYASTLIHPHIHVFIARLFTIYKLDRGKVARLLSLDGMKVQPEVRTMYTYVSVLMFCAYAIIRICVRASVLVTVCPLL